MDSSTIFARYFDYSFQSRNASAVSSCNKEAILKLVIRARESNVGGRTVAQRSNFDHRSLLRSRSATSYSVIYCNTHAPLRSAPATPILGSLRSVFRFAYPRSHALRLTSYLSQNTSEVMLVSTDFSNQ